MKKYPIALLVSELSLLPKKISNREEAIPNIKESNDRFFEKHIYIYIYNKCDILELLYQEVSQHRHAII
jgi:hypothetical protein